VSDGSGEGTGQSARAADRLLLQAARQGGRSLVLLAVTALLIAGAETALPAVLGRAVDAIVQGDESTWPQWAALLVAALVVSDVVDDLAVGATTARATAWARHALLGRVLALGPRAGRPAVGDLASRMVANAGVAGRAGPDVVRAVANLVPSAGGVVALFLIDPWLGLAFMAGLPLLLGLVRAFVRDASAMAHGYLETQAGMASRLVDAVGGRRTIAAAGTAEREVARVLEPLPVLRRFGMGTWRVQVRLAALDSLVLPLLEVVVLAVAGTRLAAGRLTPGELLAAGQYVVLASTIGSAAGTLNRLARARAAAGRVADVLAEPAPSYGGQALPPGDGRLEFEDVTVRAGDRVVLDGVSLVVPGRSLIALVGPSGSGKSLVAALAGRLVDPDQGTIRLDGVPLADLARDELRREVTYGFERPTLMGATVADAIAFGATVPTDEEVVAASCAAQADPFVRQLPEGYRTPLAATPLSGGEAQRMGLARAFAHAGRVVVLDDVAASLDTVTEHQIGNVLTGRLADRTRIVVAHRAATAARADLVVWLAGGRVRAVRNHRLLWSEPEYRAVFAADPEDQVLVDAAEVEGAAEADAGASEWVVHQ
jgi:ATP-binding cassette subfamily B protein